MHRRPLRLLRRPRPGPAGLSLALALTALGCERAKPPKPPTTQGTPAPQTPVATPPTLVHSVEGIHEYALSNGMRVLLFPDASRDRITVNITYLVGSRHEGYGETGMAHLLEHLLFKGTEAHPNPSSELQDHGAQFNGTTWLDRTNYFETMPAREENLDWALGFEADRMLNNAIAPAVLAREFSVVRNEFEMDENDAGTVGRSTRPCASSITSRAPARRRSEKCSCPPRVMNRASASWVHDGPALVQWMRPCTAGGSGPGLFGVAVNASVRSPSGETATSPVVIQLCVRITSQPRSLSHSRRGRNPPVSSRPARQRQAPARASSSAKLK